MKIKISKESWANIVKEIRLGEGLLDYSKIKPEEFIEYLSEQAFDLDMKSMQMVKE